MAFGPGKIGLGLRPCETEADGNHIIVVSIGDGTQAQKAGQIAIGDAIYSVAGVNVVGKPKEAVITMIRGSARPVTIEYTPSRGNKTWR